MQMPSFNVQAFWNAMEVQEAPDDNPEECEPNDEHDGGNDGKCDGGHNHEQDEHYHGWVHGQDKQTSEHCPPNLSAKVFRATTACQVSTILYHLPMYILLHAH